MGKTFNQITYEPVHKILVLILSVSSEGSGESVHMHRLAWAFASPKYKLQ